MPIDVRVTFYALHRGEAGRAFMGMRVTPEAVEKFAGNAVFEGTAEPDASVESLAKAMAIENCRKVLESRLYDIDGSQPPQVRFVTTDDFEKFTSTAERVHVSPDDYAIWLKWDA